MSRGTSTADLLLGRARQLRRRLSRPRYRPGSPDTSWITTRPEPATPRPLPNVRLFAILGTWFESDVVAATVHNALIQGCERVYLVDNDSPDDTVAEAVAAGAELARSFATEQYDEQVRMSIMNEVVLEVSAATQRADGDEQLWWLLLDADEFPHGPGGRTVPEHVRALDRASRVVGARFLNHYPDRRPFSFVDRHPLDFQPLCEEHVYPLCSRGHRKHPLQRWDAAGRRSPAWPASTWRHRPNTPSSNPTRRSSPTTSRTGPRR